MNQKEKRKNLQEEAQDSFYNITKAASSTDCTGLVPSGILDEAESESYSELYAIHPPKASKDGEED